MSEKNEACASGMAQHIQNEMIQSTLSKIKRKLFVMSGKGGVGKSSVAANLSIGLSKLGMKVGLLDVDLHGPSIHNMLGLTGLLETSDNSVIIPKQVYGGIKVVSMQSLMTDHDQAIIWRGPRKHAVIRQFISDIRWDELDYLIIDSPPGTGDEVLTIAQTVTDAKAIVVTTPQEAALWDVRKSIRFCKQVNLEILGIIENMAPFLCPHCGKTISLFKSDGGLKTAKEMNINLLGSLPFDPEVVSLCDNGKSPLIEIPSSAYSKAFNQSINKIVELTA